MREALFELFDLVASVGAINDAFGADRVTLASKAEVADRVVGVSIAHCLRRELRLRRSLSKSGGPRLRLLLALIGCGLVIISV